MHATRNREKDDGRDLIRDMSGSVSSRTLYIFLVIFLFYCFAYNQSEQSAFFFLTHKRSIAYNSSNSTPPNNHP